MNKIVKTYWEEVKAFSSENVPAMHLIAECRDGSILVWDEIAGFFTTIHICRKESDKL